MATGRYHGHSSCGAVRETMKSAADSEARLMDLPVPLASARYSRDLDPVNSAPTTEVVDAWARS